MNLGGIIWDNSCAEQVFSRIPQNTLQHNSDSSVTQLTAVVHS